MRTEFLKNAVGRAKAVVMSGTSGQAAITTVVGQVRRCSKGERIRYRGGIPVAPRTRDHVEALLIPLVDEIVCRLGLVKHNFDLTVLNLDGVSAKDIPAILSGHSADVPIFSCLLSAGLNLPLRQDVLATGELGSAAGDITMVSGIPAKAAAAAADPEVNFFLYPSLDRDNSLATLAPNERECIQEALAVASSRVRTVPITNIVDALTGLFEDDAIALCSLRQGFWSERPPSGAEDTPLDEAIRFFTADNKQRYWRALERALFARDSAGPHQLLDAFVQFHLSRKTYPAEFGTGLFQIVHSLPPATRRLKTPFPLIPIEDYIALSQFAGPSDYEDLRFLNEICFSKAKAFESLRSIEETGEAKGDLASGEAAVSILLEEFSPETIEAKVCNPIDEAYNQFYLPSIHADSRAACLETATALYCQLQRYSKTPFSVTAYETVEHKTLALLEEAFAYQGGVTAACAEACQPTRLGGMRHVLKVMTDCYKAKAVREHLLWLISKGVDPLNGEHVAFAREIQRRFAPFLSPEDIEPDAEILGSRWEELARAYANSLDTVKKVLRTR